MIRNLIAALLALTVSACASSSPPPGGTLATASFPVATATATTAVGHDYRISAYDRLTITVFQVEDLKLEKIQVDANGQVSLPLIGGVTAAGKTTAELSAEIARRLSERYMRDPQVTVLVEEAVSQKVTVEGAVREPGVYLLKGRTSLIQAVAMARGVDRSANLKRVAVFRTENGQRVGAVFDLGAIRAGEAPDPEILGDDIVVVDSSAVKGFWREVIGALPALGVFRPY